MTQEHHTVTQKPHYDHWTINERKKNHRQNIEPLPDHSHRQTITIRREKWELVRIKYIYIYFTIQLQWAVIKNSSL